MCETQYYKTTQELARAERRRSAIAYLAGAVILAGAFAAYFYLSDECEGRGGVLVRGAFWYECLAAERR